MPKNNKYLFLQESENPVIAIPETWPEAYGWRDKVNKGREEWREPLWKWDCGLKLDFDGPIIRVSSRFYPDLPWNGVVKICIGNYDVSGCAEDLQTKRFECDSLNQLKEEVEAYVIDIGEKVAEFIKGLEDD